TSCSRATTPGSSPDPLRRTSYGVATTVYPIGAPQLVWKHRVVTYTVAGPDGVELSDDRSRLDVDQVHAWLKASYWAHDRDRETLDRAIANSRPYGVYAPDGSQVAFTRAVTDLAAFCWLADVVVDDAWRGRGIGTWLVGAIVEHLRG